MELAPKIKNGENLEFYIRGVNLFDLDLTKQALTEHLSELKAEPLVEHLCKVRGEFFKIILNNL